MTKTRSAFEVAKGTSIYAVVMHDGTVRRNVAREEYTLDAVRRADLVILCHGPRRYEVAKHRFGTSGEIMNRKAARDLIFGTVAWIRDGRGRLGS